MEAKTIYKTQKALHEQLSKAIINHKKAGKTRRTEGYYRTRIETFNSIWNQFQTNHTKLYAFDTKESEEYIQGTLYEDTEELYIEYISEFKDELKALAITSSENISEQIPPTETPKNELKLPKIMVPKFDGTYTSWRSFHDLFKSLIHNDPSLSKVQKFHYLKTCVTGEAERLLRQFDVTESNYIKAWEFLQKRYDNKRILVNTQLKILFNQPSIKNESAHSIKTLLDQTEESLHELRCLNIPTENWDTILIYLISNKLPAETRYQWEQLQGNKTIIPSYKELVEFLDSRFRTLEALQDNRNERSQTHSTPKKTLSFLNKAHTCPKCKRDHFLYRCNEFNKLSPKIRSNLVNNWHLCKNCLSAKHKTAECTSTRNCFKCQKRHHTLIHLDNLSLGSKSSQSEQNTNKQTTNKTTQSFFTNNCKKALLSTALVIAKTNTGENLMLRALIDSGSQVSFITEQACKKLKLRKRHIDIQVTGLGKTRTANVNTQVTLTLKSIHSEYKIKTNALILQKITDNIPPRSVNVPNLHYLGNIKLADPKFNTPGPIDLLLGADVYSQIIENGIIKGEKGYPTAQNTQLGWILMGRLAADNRPPRSFTNQVQKPKSPKTQRKGFWKREKITPKISPPKKKKCKKHFVNKHKQLSNGQNQIQVASQNPTRPKPETRKIKAIKGSIKKKPFEIAPSLSS